MKSVLISIRPEWCGKIAMGRKTIEIRKTAPKIAAPFKCYIYCTKGNPSDPHQRLETHSDGRCFLANGKVFAEFICDFIEPVSERNKAVISTLSCVPLPELYDYAGAKGLEGLFGWHISDLKVYDKPKELCEYTKYSDGDIRPCQNGCECQYEYYDYSEDCVACGIDFDGENCPFIKLQRPPQSWCYAYGTESEVDNGQA